MKTLPRTLVAGAVVLALAAGAYLLSRPKRPNLPEGTDQQVVDYVYDELLPPVVLQLRDTCDLPVHVKGKLIVHTADNAIVVGTFTPDASLSWSKEQVSCFSTRLLGVKSTPPKFNPPDDREYEVDLSGDIPPRSFE